MSAFRRFLTTLVRQRGSHSHRPRTANLGHTVRRDRHGGRGGANPVRKSLLLLVALVAVLSTGCIQADLKLDVNDDGSGTYSAVIAVNAKLLQSLGGLAALDPDAEPASGSTGDVCQDMVKDAQSDTPEGGKVEPYKKGDFCGVKLTA